MEQKFVYLLKTLGCKANFFDSGLIEAELQKRGWVARQSNASDTPVRLCIINTCTVTDEADRKGRQLASRLARENPEARIVVTGCSAEINPELLSQSKGIHYVIGNRGKAKLVEKVLEILDSVENPPSLQNARVLGDGKKAETVSRHGADRIWPEPTSDFPLSMTHTRHFVKIQEGCNRFCTFCIIPYARGPSRSVPIASLVSSISSLCEKGVREIVLTGTNLGDYGSDGGESLFTLLQAVLNETAIERLRMSSLDPAEITRPILQLMEREKRLCPHFHVSLQSPHSRVLKRMKRPYGFEQVRESLQAIASIGRGEAGSEPFVGMDVIAGFSDESDAEFEWTVQALKELPWHRLHVFPYSEREGTPATRLPNPVSQAEKERRAKKLRALSFERLTTHYERLLDRCTQTHRPLKGILIEGKARHPDFPGGKLWSGVTPQYLRVLFEWPLEEKSNITLCNKTVSLNPIRLLKDERSGDVAFLAQRFSGIDSI